VVSPRAHRAWEIRPAGNGRSPLEPERRCTCGRRSPGRVDDRSRRGACGELSGQSGRARAAAEEVRAFRRRHAADVAGEDVGEEVGEEIGEEIGEDRAADVAGEDIGADVDESAGDERDVAEADADEERAEVGPGSDEDDADEYERTPSTTSPTTSRSGTDFGAATSSAPVVGGSDR